MTDHHIPPAIWRELQARVIFAGYKGTPHQVIKLYESTVARGGTR